MSLPYYNLAKPATVTNFVKRLDDQDYALDPYTLLAGDGAAREIKLGTPLGKITAAGAVSATRAAVAGNIGNGTLTLANPAFAAGAMLGTYSVTCTTGGADATSKFRVEDPEGVFVGEATGGAAFDKAVKFTIAGGGTDFVEGDAFTVTLSQASGADDGKIVAWDPDAADGSEKLWGFAWNDVTAADGVDNPGGLAVRREAVLRDGGILWPAGLSDADHTAAIEAADLRGIVIRV